MSFVCSSVSRNNLSGSLPSLSKLSMLKSLYISDCGLELSGGIAYICDTLTDLEILSATSMKLSGDMTNVCDFSKLTKLTTIFFNDNKLTGSIPSLTGLTMLHTLFVDDTQ